MVFFHEVLKFVHNFESVMGTKIIRTITEMNHEGSIHTIGLIIYVGVYQKSFASVVTRKVT